jgi:hypothetical protein
VALKPDAIPDRPVRRCWQDALDRGAKGPVTLELEFRGTAAQLANPTAADVALGKCVLDRVGPAMQQNHIPSARVDLR